MISRFHHIDPAVGSRITEGGRRNRQSNCARHPMGTGMSWWISRVAAASYVLEYVLSELRPEPAYAFVRRK
jgi:hypothetical protein